MLHYRWRRSVDGRLVLENVLGRGQLGQQFVTTSKASGGEQAAHHDWPYVGHNHGNAVGDHQYDKGGQRPRNSRYCWGATE